MIDCGPQTRLEQPASRRSSGVAVVVDEAVLRALVAEEVERVMTPVLDAVRRCNGTQAPCGQDLVNGAELSELLGIDRRTLRRLELEDQIPTPIVIGDRTKRWRRSVIEKWLRTLEQRA